MKNQRNIGKKLQLSRETIRQLLSEELLHFAVGGGCPSLTGCSHTGPSLDECGSIYCSKPQM